MEPTEDEVVTELWNLLPTVDMDSETTKDILRSLKAHFGVSVRQYKKRIKTEILKFIKEEPKQSEQEPEQSEQEPEQSEQEPEQSEQESMQLEQESMQPEQESMQPEQESMQPEQESMQPEQESMQRELEGEHAFAVELSKNVYLRVTEFCGVRRVDIRHFYEHGKEEKRVLKPSGKGICFTKEEFVTLLENVNELKRAAEERQMDYEVNITSKKRASISEFRGNVRIDLRNYYSDNSYSDAMKPTKKGLSFDVSTLDVIKQHEESVLNAFHAQSDKSKTPMKRSLQREDSPVRKHQKKGTEEVRFAMELGSRIRIRVQPFKGILRTDIRNYYKDRATGEELPTQKGISLTKEQVEILVQSLDKLKSAVDRKDADFFVELGPLRRASIFNLKGRLMIDLREYYKKGDKDPLKPGKKGVCFDPNLLETLMNCQNEILDAMSK
eukprot:g2609.t1